MKIQQRLGLQPLWLIVAVVVGILAGILPVLVGLNPLYGVVLVVGIVGLLFLILAWPFSGVAILILAALVTRYRFDAGPVSVRAEHIAAIAVAGLAFIQLMVNRGRIRFPAAAWFATGWWMMNVISGFFFSPDPVVGLQNSIRLGLLVLTFVLILNLIPNRHYWYWAVGLFLVTGVLEAAFGVIARVLFPFGINLGVQVSWNFSEPIPYGTFEEGNLFGSHTGVWAIILLMVLLGKGGWRRPDKHHIFLATGLAVLVLGLFLSLSRAAWLMFALGAAIVWIFYIRDAWHQTNRFLLVLTAAPVALLVVIAVVPLLPSSLPLVNRLQSFLSLGTDATFSARLSDWGLAWDDWMAQPLTGWGPGSFAAIHGELRARPAWISNLGLRLLQETGVVGTIMFLGYVFTLVVPAIRVAHRRIPPLDRALLLGLVISFLVLVGIAYQSTDGIWIAASWVHAGLIAAGTFVLSHVPDEQNTDPLALLANT